MQLCKTHTAAIVLISIASYFTFIVLWNGEVVIATKFEIAVTAVIDLNGALPQTNGTQEMDSNPGTEHFN